MALALDTARYAARIAELDASRRHARLWRYGRYALIAALVAWSVEAIVIGDTDWTRITWAGVVSSAWRFIDFDASILKSLWEPALETVLMATLATILGAAMAIPIAWLGALNISPLGRFTYLLGRVSMTLSRSVHEVVWGLVFVAAVGLGALAGILAMAVRSIGFISKSVAEAIEDVNKGPVEAMRAVGANRFQVLMLQLWRHRHRDLRDPVAHHIWRGLQCLGAKEGDLNEQHPSRPQRNRRGRQTTARMEPLSLPSKPLQIRPAAGRPVFHLVVDGRAAHRPRAPARPISAPG